jgi:hypothetical protein
MLKRYLVFAGDSYYPGGGWEDFVDSFDSLDEAHASAATAQEKSDWSHVVDTHTGQVVYSA